MFEFDHFAFDFSIFVCDSVGGVVGGVGASGVYEGVALGHVAVGILEVVGHDDDFNIKIIMM